MPDFTIEGTTYTRPELDGFGRYVVAVSWPDGERFVTYAVPADVFAHYGITPFKYDEECKGGPEGCSGELFVSSEELLIKGELLAARTFWICEGHDTEDQSSHD